MMILPRETATDATVEIQERWRNHDYGNIDHTQYLFLQSLSRYKNPSRNQVFWIHSKSTECWPDQFSLDDPPEKKGTSLSTSFVAVDDPTSVSPNLFSDLSAIHKETSGNSLWFCGHITLNATLHKIRFSEGNGYTNVELFSFKSEDWRYAGKLEGNHFKPFKLHKHTDLVREILSLMDGQRDLYDVFQYIEFLPVKSELVG